ncbi:MAG: TetR/AcrR family transcriptional regulator [Polyangiales bacterium]|nr:TetR/AcrR family transcriptional regulator [Sandaracinaceae bacterium]
MSAPSPRASASASEIARRPKGRSERVQRQVFDAALAILARDGRGALSMEAIAHEADVHKTTLYRRWGSVETLVREACADYDDTSIKAPDTGSFEGDVRALAQQFGRYLSQPITQAIVRMVVSDAPHDQELREWADEFWLTRSGPFDTVVERAIARGELPAHVTAIELAEPLIGPMILRALVTGFELDDRDFLDRLATLVLRGLTL